MLFGQIPQTPNIPTLYQRQQMQRPHRLAVPVKIRQHQKPKLWVAVLTRVPQDDIFLFSPAFEDVKHPVESALLSLRVHVWPDIIPVCLRCLCHHSQHLVRILLDVLLRAGPNKTELQVLAQVVCLSILPAARSCKVPAVDVVVAQVLHPRNGCMEGLQDLDGLGCKCCSFGDQDALFFVNRPQECDATAVLVYRL